MSAPLTEVMEEIRTVSLFAGGSGRGDVGSGFVALIGLDLDAIGQRVSGSQLTVTSTTTQGCTFC